MRTGSLVICSQFSPAGWHAKLGGGAIADAVIDRIVYRSDVIHIEGDESMRKRIGCFRQDRSFMGGTLNFHVGHCKFSRSARHAA